MGVPKFFRWVSDRYPLLLSGVIDESFETPEIDNLYLDMNGIIHNCSHDNEKLSVAGTSATAIQKVLHEIDRLVSVVVKPLAVLFIAVDGVAPRAKLNQQRSRRFKSAKERLKSIESAKLKDPSFNESEVFDSNCITPGTEFMVDVTHAIKKFIEQKISDSSSLWSKLTVYFSGSEVPGEGEHKIMSFIRELRASPSHRPNVRHCMNGSDADMIMLSLATHEPHFLVLREVVHYGKQRKPRKSLPPAVEEHPLQPSEVVDEPKTKHPPKPKDLQFVRIHILREYLMMDLLEGLDASQYCVERVIDDFVFLTFFIGNDFLPCLPALDIGDDAFDIIFDAYKFILAQKNDKKDVGYDPYLVNGDIIDLSKLEQIVAIIGSTEILMYSQSRMTRKQRRNLKSPESSGDSGLSSADEPGTSSNETSEKKDEKIRWNLAKNQYYMKKFGTDITTSEGYTVLRSIACSYLQGLQWCLSYYTRGCVSWSWFYPHHYGPFLHDLTDLTSKEMQFRFELSEPFTPFQQLLACLPANSCSLLPLCYHQLMTSPSSPLIEYYPAVFRSDRNGKRQAYEAVVLLPFIDRQKLLSAESVFCPGITLTTNEAKRNAHGVTYKYHNGNGVIELLPWLRPAECFKSELIAGTEVSIPGFLSLQQEHSKKGFTHQLFSKPPKNSRVIADLDKVTYFPSEFSIRLLLNDAVNFFLSDLCKQLEGLRSDFQSVLNNKCDGCIYGGGGPVNQFYVTVLSNCNILFTKRVKDHPVRVVADKPEDAEQSAKALSLLQTLLGQYVTMSSGVVESSLLPECRIDIVPVSMEKDGVRKVMKVNQVSLNIEKTPTYKALEILLTSKIRTDLFDHERVNEKQHFYRSKMAIVLGYYNGEDCPSFLKWVNAELSNFKRCFPPLVCRDIDLVYSFGDNQVFHYHFSDK